jgi:hypothetical protein
MKETEGFPPYLFTLHYYLLPKLQFIGLLPDKLQFIKPSTCSLIFLSEFLLGSPLQIPEKSLTSIPMYGTIIYYKESRKAPGKEANI